MTSRTFSPRTVLTLEVKSERKCVKKDMQKYSCTIQIGVHLCNMDCSFSFGAPFQRLFRIVVVIIPSASLFYIHLLMCLMCNDFFTAFAYPNEI